MNRLANILLAVLMLALIAIGSTVIVPTIVGLKPVNIVAGSMTPTMPYGTIALVDPAQTPKLGDVITYKFGANTPVTHRITAIRPDPSGNSLEYVTKGDHNQTDDQQPVPPEAVIGVVTATIPFAGLATNLIGQLPVQLFLMTIATGLWWASKQKPKTIRNIANASA